MTVHILTSPPATGKTQFIIDLVKSTTQNTPLTNAWFLVPDQTQADEVRARLSTSGGTIPVRVATFNELFIEIQERTGSLQPIAGSSMLRRLLQEIINDLSNKGQIPHYAPICGSAGFLNEVRDRIAEFKQALIPPERLVEVAQEQSDLGLIDLSRIYAAYRTRLQELGWLDLDGLAWAANEALSSHREVLTDLPLLVVDGFVNFNPALLHTLQLIAGQVGELWITLPGTPEMDRLSHQRSARIFKSLSAALALDIQTLTNSPFLPSTLRRLEAGLFETHIESIAPGCDLERIEVRSSNEEAREALRWIKARIVRDNLDISACAVAVPEFEPYRAPLQDAADEFGLPIYFTQRLVISATPLGAALMDLLKLSLQDYPLRPLLDSIRTPYFNLAPLNFQTGDAKLLEITSRYGQIVQGIAQWEETLKALSEISPDSQNLEDRTEEGFEAPRLPNGKVAARLLNSLQALSGLLTPPSLDMPYRQWALWLQELIERIGLFDCLANVDQTELSATLDHLVLSLAHCETLTGPCPTDYAGFLSEWEGLMTSTSVRREQADENQAGIRVMSMTDARGIRTHALAVLGLAEGVFPTIERADPFISEEIRGILGMEPSIGKDQAALFYQVITRADRFLLLTRPSMAKDGESWEPSPYWNVIQEMLQDRPIRIQPDMARPLHDAASSNELLFWAGRRRSKTGLDIPYAFLEKYASRWQHIAETRDVLASRLLKETESAYDGNLSGIERNLAGRYGERAGWSASRLEAYAACPFSFLASSALGLEVIEAPQIGYQANQLGTILHAVLEKVYPQASNPADPAEVLSNLPEVARRVFASAPQEYKFRPSLLWDMQQAELLLILEATIQGIADLDPAQGWKPLVFEAKFGLGGAAPLVLHTSGGDIRLHGFIDRIDINQDGKLRVIDYKSGGSHLTPLDFLDGRRLQLPIYALAASQALGLGDVAEGFYWKLFQTEASSLRLSRFKYEGGAGPSAAFDLARRFIEDIVTRVRQGAFQPIPPQGGCPDYCVAASWCWHYHPARF